MSHRELSSVARYCWISTCLVSQWVALTQDQMNALPLVRMDSFLDVMEVVMHSNTRFQQTLSTVSSRVVLEVVIE